MVDVPTTQPLIDGPDLEQQRPAEQQAVNGSSDLNSAPDFNNMPLRRMRTSLVSRRRLDEMRV